MSKTPTHDPKTRQQDQPLRLNMTFEQAVKAALNTPLPKKEKKKK